MNVYETGMAKAFSRAAAAPERTSGNDFLDAILRERTDLAEKIEAGEMTAYFPEQGESSHTVIIGDEVFKGPVGKFQTSSLDKEIEILKKLAGAGLPVPEVTCVGKDAVFYGMTRMAGVHLESVYEDMTPDEMRTLAKEIADFTIDMALALPRKQGCYARHGDLHTNNILVDPETRKLRGIIDFGIVDYSSKETLGQDSVWWWPNEDIAQGIEQRKAELPDPLFTRPMPVLQHKL